MAATWTATVLLALALLAVTAAAAAPQQQPMSPVDATLHAFPWLSRDKASALADLFVELERMRVLNGTSMPEAVAPELVWDCPPLPKREPAQHIKDLHPADVRLVGAIGDSITTGCDSLSTSILNLKDYPGISWAVGGDTGKVTMPNILSQYAGPLAGLSFGTGDTAMHCNLAKNGAVAQNMRDQAVTLIETMKATPGIRFDEDWKVVTVLVGGNNLCDVCEKGHYDDNDGQAFEDGVRHALTVLADGSPRTFVNLVLLFDPTQLASFKSGLCSVILYFICDCITSSDKAKQQLVRETLAQYWERSYRVAAEFEGRDDFAVVVQPIFQQAIIPNKSYISEADCFHPSGSGQAALAIGLWNSMIIPVGEKPTNISIATATPTCATNSTLLYSSASPRRTVLHGPHGGRL